MDHHRKSGGKIPRKNLHKCIELIHAASLEIFSYMVSCRGNVKGNNVGNGNVKSQHSSIVGTGTGIFCKYIVESKQPCDK